MIGSAFYWLIKGLFRPGDTEYLKEGSEKPIDPAHIARVEEELNKTQLDNYEKAREVYPSLHLRNDEDAWLKKLEEQREYAEILDKNSEELIAKKYGLNPKQLKTIKSALFVKNARKTMETKERKDFNNSLKK